MYSPLIPNDDEVIAILRSGKNIVTPVGWVYPDPGNPRHRRSPTPPSTPG